MNILVSGLINIETNVAVRGFPIDYYPIDYAFFGVESSVGGVGYNVSKALTTLGDSVTFCSFTGNDLNNDIIKLELDRQHVHKLLIKNTLKATPTSAVLHEPSGRRQIYCDLKDIQEQSYSFDCEDDYINNDLYVICNINFNRAILPVIKALGKPIATDVHVLSDIHDEYNKDFLKAADILFLSDEAVKDNYEEFILSIAKEYNTNIIVMGRGKKGVAYYEKADGTVRTMPIAESGNVVNTIGAGDALFSSFIHFYSKGFSVENSLAYAQKFASIKIQTNGAANGFVTEDKIL